MKVGDDPILAKSLRGATAASVKTLSESGKMGWLWFPGTLWAFNMPVAYKRFADIAEAMGVDTYGMTDVQAADAALAAAIRLLRDVNIIERFVDVKQDSYSKNRLGQGPTKFYENAPVIKGDKADVDRITNHVLGDACTPGNAKECTFDLVRPVVDHCMNGDLDDLLS